MNDSGRILIADDEDLFREATVEVLREEGYDCDGAVDAYAAAALLQQKEYDLIIADIRMPGNEDLALFKRLQEAKSETPVVVVTGYPGLDAALPATRLSVAGFLAKPIDMDTLLHLTQELLNSPRAGSAHSSGREPATSPTVPGDSWLPLPAKAAQTVPLSAGLDTPALAPRPVATKALPPAGAADLIEGIVGGSAVMLHVFERVQKAAPGDQGVLIYGETGTGKELIARAIHQLSPRRECGFVPVDCAALPANLLESELFGYEKGAFTGATGRKLGLLEFAQGGTFFFDEISEMDPGLQAKLLRVLQERKFRRLGGKDLIDLDVRVIAAMNRSPRKAMADGRLRRDLYYRLNVIPIYLPPLRRRRDDIPLLVEHFLHEANQRRHSPPKCLTPDALALLKSQRWPGNVRQLKNVVERLVSLSTGFEIDETDLASFVLRVKHATDPGTVSVPYAAARKRKLSEFERDYFTELMKQSEGVVETAAKLSGLSERTIYRMLRRYGKPF